MLDDFSGIRDSNRNIYIYIFILSLIDDFGIEILGCFDLPVAPPAGFPDHPHRGSAFIPSISFLFVKLYVFMNHDPYILMLNLFYRF
jgi:hypothetical protein